MDEQPDIETVSRAMLSAYPSMDRLRSLLLRKGGLRLDWEVNVRQGYRLVAEEVADLYRSQGETAKLIAILASENPYNPVVRALVESATPATAAVVAQVSAAEPPAKPANLEAMVRKRSRLVNMSEFRRRLDGVAPRLCLVETPVRTGTGFLVGDGTVLTNYHVVEELVRGSVTFDQVVCVFDHAGGLVRRRVGLGGPPQAASPYDPSDLSGTGSPAIDRLDYALLPLAETVGSGPGPDGGARRGWITLDPLARILATNDFLVICQHPAAREQELAIGVLVAMPEALRLRYDVTTEEGSSGSPCFDTELAPVGLHHAADPRATPTYNQAIPLWLVARDARNRGFALTAAA